MSLRKEFVLRALSGDERMAALCREYGISRKTGYKWIQRFKDQGIMGLVDQSRRPASSPLETAAETVEEILSLRKEHPTWGPKKLARILEKRREDGAPSRATIARVLNREGVVRRRRRYRKPSMGKPSRAPNYSVQGPNDLWTADYKGWWRTKDGARCEPLTIRDAYSRFVLALRLTPNTTISTVRKVFEELFDKHGLPKAIQTDNGQPWASVRSLGGMTKLSAWWISLGIEIVRSRPGCPQDNGAHERMHGDVRVEIQQNAARSRRAQQKACDAWRQEFNFVRPHEAIDLQTPAELYRPSSRRPGGVVIGGHPECCSLRHVTRHGHFGYQRAKLYLGTAFAGHQVALQPDGDAIIVWFYDHPIGRFVPGQDYTVQPLDFETCHPSQVPK